MEPWMWVAIAVAAVVLIVLLVTSMSKRGGSRPRRVIVRRR